ncbi:hypothetical protein ES702_06145 [subsurface metagenome]
MNGMNLEEVEALDRAQIIADQWSKNLIESYAAMELITEEIQKINLNGNPPLKKKSEDPKARTLYQDLEEGLEDEDIENMKIYTPQPKIKKGSQGSLFEQG